jgi:hypothetical protein
LWNNVPDALSPSGCATQSPKRICRLERQIRRNARRRSSEASLALLLLWLGLGKLSNADPDKQFFPDYDVSLRDAFAKETQLFVLSQLRDDRDPVELWSANYSFLNEQLARHYNVPNIQGPQFRKVILPLPERAGLLGQGSVLMVTSRHNHGTDAAYTTPAGRSIWVRLHYLGAPAPMPFPNAPPVKPELPITPQTRTLPVEPCMTCHRNFFPLGYALEN